MPVKVEINHDDEEYGNTNVGLSAMCPAIDNDDNMYLDDLDINALETDGKLFCSKIYRLLMNNLFQTIVGALTVAKCLAVPKTVDVTKT